VDLVDLLRPIRPICTQQLSLRQNRPDGFLLQVRRVAVFIEDTLDHHSDLGAGSFADRPVDGNALAHLRDQLGGYELEKTRGQSPDFFIATSLASFESCDPVSASCPGV
jgi:hypothetical protein